MRIIIKAVPERQDFIDYLKRNLPTAEFCMDEKQCAFDTFNRSLAMAGDEPCIHMEEDIILTKDFESKAQAVIQSKPNAFIQFFSMRKADLTIGSRWDNDFLMNQCWYAPAGYSKAMLDFYPMWAAKHLEAHPNGTDLMVKHFLQASKVKYWIHCPSLVDHRIARSVINPTRSSKRQSLTFTDPQE